MFQIRLNNALIIHFANVFLNGNLKTQIELLERLLLNPTN